MSKAILRDNDAQFIDTIIRQARSLDPDCIVNIRSIIHTHQIDIQTGVENKNKMFNLVRHIHNMFGLSFKATEFIKDKETLISFQLSDYE